MNDEQSKKLKLFHERVVRLKQNTDFFVNLSLNFKWDREEGTTVTFKGPDPKTIKSLLLDFRPFIAQKEPVNFNHVANLIEKNVSDSKIIETLREIRQAWCGLLQKKEVKHFSGFKLVVNNEQLLSEKNIDLWINGEYFHLDDQKRQFLENLKHSPMISFSFYLFLDSIQRLSIALFWLDDEVINKVLKAI